MERSLLIAAALVVIGFALVQIRRHRDIFHPVCNQALLVGLFLGVRVFWILGGHDEFLMSADDPDAVLWAAMVFYLGFFAISIGSFQFFGRCIPLLRKWSYVVRTYGPLKFSLRLLALPYVVAGPISMAILARSIGIGSFLSDVAGERAIFEGNWSLLYGLVAPFIAATVFYGLLLQGDKRFSTKLLFFGSLIIGLSGAVLTGSRGYGFHMLIPLLVLGSVIKKKTNYVLVLLVLLFGVAMFPVMDGIVYGHIWPDIVSGNVQVISQYWSDRAADLFAYAYGRYYTLEATARTLFFLDHGMATFDQGRLVLAFPRIVLPTALVGWKPAVTREIAQTFFFDRYGYDTLGSAVTSLPAFMYWQAGWLGYVLSGIGYGLFLRYWVRIYEAEGLGNALFVAITYPIFLMTFVGHIGTLAELIYVHIMVSPLLRFSTSLGHAYASSEPKRLPAKAYSIRS
jgi:hypothetical protein